MIKSKHSPQIPDEERQNTNSKQNLKFKCISFKELIHKF